MITNILIIVCIVLLIAILYSRKQSNLLHAATEHLKTIPTSIKLVDDTPPETTRNVTKKHYITINGNQSVKTYEFNKTLKNVKHIELVSAIIPKTNYKIDEFNDEFFVTINSNTYNFGITNGVYQNISELLLEINRQIYLEVVVDEYGENSGAVTDKFLNIVMDNMSKKIIFLTNINDTITFNFNRTLNVPFRLLGIEENEITIESTTSPNINDYLITCYFYITSLWVDGYPVNNLPDSYYNALNAFPPTSTDFTTDWYFASGQSRVNIMQQLYMDITLDNITYWDGTNILNKTYVDETEPVTMYQRQYPSYRSLSENNLKLDKLTLRFYSITEPGKKQLYNFNGIDYSLQLEIITKNKELII
jgi:hypothetical protein